MCNNNCGTEIHFSDNAISKTGKKIPLEGDNTPHNCPMSKYYKPQQKKRRLFGYYEDEGYKHFGDFIIHEDDVQETLKILTNN